MKELMRIKESMTVKQLKNKLKNLPEDATVVICNEELFEDGYYKVTDVNFDPECNEVEIATDHKWRKDEDDGKWKL